MSIEDQTVAVGFLAGRAVRRDLGLALGPPAPTSRRGVRRPASEGI